MQKTYWAAPYETLHIRKSPGPGPDGMLFVSAEIPLDSFSRVHQKTEIALSLAIRRFNGGEKLTVGCVTCVDLRRFFKENSMTNPNGYGNFVRSLRNGRTYTGLETVAEVIEEQKRVLDERVARKEFLAPERRDEIETNECV